MSLNFFRFAYGLSTCPAWPALSKGDVVPDHLKSRYANPGRDSKVGLGLVKAVAATLTGDVTFFVHGDDVATCYESNTGGRHTAWSNERSDGTRGWYEAARMQAPVLLCLAEAVLMDPPLHEEVRERWWQLIDVLQRALPGERPPYSEGRLANVSHRSDASEAMMALTDGIYFAIKEASADGRVSIESGGGANAGAPQHLPAVDHRRLFEPEVPTPLMAAGSRGILRTLVGLARAGGTALLIGPTGTLKTSTAKRAALDTGARLVVLKGRPGIEDRDFIGGVYPGMSGPVWVDGPVTAAFRAAQEGPVIFLVDELLRFNPLYLGALVGLLDPYDEDELRAMGVDPVGSGTHLLAELPTGERVPTPAASLTLIATTNIGDDYVQATHLDAALLRRFEVVVDVERADAEVARTIYAGEFGDDVAEVLVDIEAFTHENLARDGGLLARPANPGVLINLARAVIRGLGMPSERGSECEGDPAPGDPAVSDPASGEDAWRSAAQVTLAPYCADREPDGRLDPAGAALLTDEVARLSARLGTA
jgi:nitric oxide reductase NorQ protein